MTGRFRWFHCALNPAMLNAIEAEFSAAPFSKRSGKGYRVIRRRRSEIEFEYIERQESVKEVSTPLGGVERYTSIDYAVASFCVSAMIPLLEFINPPRAISSVLAALGGYVSIGTVLAPAQVSPSEWLLDVETLCASVEVRAMTFAGVALGRDVAASSRVEGARDVRAVVEQWLGRRDRRLLALELDADGIRLELKDGGRARVIDGDLAKGRRLLRDSLAAAVARLAE